MSAAVEHIVIITRKGEKHETSFSDADQARRFANGMRNMPGFSRPDSVETIQREVTDEGDA